MADGSDILICRHPS